MKSKKKRKVAGLDPERARRFVWEPGDIKIVRKDGKWLDQKAKEEIYAALKAKGITDVEAWLDRPDDVVVVREISENKRKKGKQSKKP